jgi:hypothetical protein
MALISKQIVRHIEGELRSYPQKIKMVKEQRDEIILGSHYPDVSVSGGELSNTTQSKGMRLAQLETGWPELISQALEIMPMEYSLLLKYTYFENKNYDRSSEALHVSKTLYYAWKENAILMIAFMAAQKGLMKERISS